MTDGTSELMVATKNGMVIRFEEDTLRAMSRSAHGVKAIKLRGDDEVVSLQAVTEGSTILTVTDKGYGRRVTLDSYRVQRRGGYGMLNYKVNDVKGRVCGIRTVSEDDDVILISNDGIIIRVRASDISIMGRYSGGVTIMKTKNSPDRLVAAFTTAEHDDDAEIEEVEQLSSEELAKIAEEEAIAESEEVISDDDAEVDEEEEALAEGEEE